MSLLRTMALVMLICWFVVACAGTGGFDRSAVAAVPLAQPEAASGLTTKPGWVARRFAVAAANPLASQAGAQVLRQGGSAVDAAIAVQMVLTLVEPQSSGIGGGAFLLHHDGRRVQAFDGRETAPAAAEPTLFLDQKGTPLPFMEALVGGRSVGTPGAVAMLAQAHHQHGKLPWASLFEPAIGLAEDGFAVSPRLHTLLKTETALQKDPVAAAYFYNDDGQPHPVGHVLKNPDLAAVLRAIASKGPQAFYDGPVALAMVNKVQQHPANPGRLNAEDLKHYQPKDREALCFQHLVQQRALRICGFPPPGSGALAIGQIMGLLARTPHATAAPAPGAPPSPDWLHTYTEASRLAFADRAQYLADPDFVEAPAGRWHSLLDAHYLDDRARLIGNARMTTVPAGQPGGVNSSWASMPEQPEYGTSHISIVDAQGNVFATFSGPRGQKTPVAVYRIAPDGEMEPYLTDLMNATGLAFDSLGVLHVSSRFDGFIYQIPSSGVLNVFVEGMGVATGIAFDLEDNLYVGDRSGTIFKISPTRQVYVFATVEASIAAFHLAFGPGGYLYVSGPTTSSNDAVHRVAPNGDVEVFYRGLGRPQGLAFDVDGNLYVAGSTGGRRGIIRITPEREASVFLTGPNIVGLAFAPGGDMIVATTSALYRVHAGVIGRPLV